MSGLTASFVYTIEAMNEKDEVEICTELLVEDTLSGELDKFGDLVDLYQSDVERVVVKILRNPREKDDWVQQTFVKAYEHLGELKNPVRFGPWVKSIARNLILNHLKSAALHKQHLRLYRDHLALIYADRGPDRYEDERSELLEQCRGKISDDANLALDLRYREGLSMSNIAEKMGKSVQATEKLLSRVRMSLRDCVEANLRTP